jgi:UTP-glucose-1-phosphate uridylyltransferase
MDSFLAPLCPDQLRAPVLHSLLDYAPIRPYVLAGKGVGSGGDGAAQLLCRDAAAMEHVAGILARDLGMGSLPLVIRSVPRLRKALIPAAGFGTRLFPASKAVRKELFPIVDRSGRAKPAIVSIVEELAEAGIEEVGIVVGQGEEQVFKHLFDTPPTEMNYERLSPADREYCSRLAELGRMISYVAQEEPNGFGHAVLRARDWIGGEPFLLALGDHLYRSRLPTSCARQLLDVYERYGTSVVGLKTIDEEELGRFGCVNGRWFEDRSIIELSEIVEKPAIEAARARLRVEGLAPGRYLALFGQYVLTPAVFALLEQDSRSLADDRELELTPALDLLRARDGFLGLMVEGESFDIGVPASYREAMDLFGRP